MTTSPHQRKEHCQTIINQLCDDLIVELHPIVGRVPVLHKGSISKDELTERLEEEWVQMEISNSYAEYIKALSRFLRFLLLHEQIILRNIAREYQVHQFLLRRPFEKVTEKVLLGTLLPLQWRLGSQGEADL